MIQKSMAFWRNSQLCRKTTIFFQKPFFSDYRTMLGLWMIMALGTIPRNLNNDNNFDIFRYVYFHLTNFQPLYEPYPDLYSDLNHYGPLFGLIIAPFALTPHPIGLILWHVIMTAILWYSIYKLDLSHSKKILIYWFCANELFTALVYSQFNVMVVALIVGTYICIKKEKDIWAALFIVIGTLVKLYGIVGLAFFLFSRHKGRFCLWLAIWTVILFCAPMLISSVDYVVGQYHAWYISLTEKNCDNMFSLMQNVSLLGIVRKTTHDSTYSDLWLIIPGLIAFASPYLRFKQYRNDAFCMTFLASVLLFVVLFSTGSESCGYIIALIGAAIWYTCAPWKRSRTDLYLMIFAFVLTSLSPTDIFPKILWKTMVHPYALKALPCVLIWFKLIFEMLTRDYAAPYRTQAKQQMTHNV